MIWRASKKYGMLVFKRENKLPLWALRRTAFLEPQSDSDDLIGEGIMNRVLRLTEEAGRISESIAREYGFERQAASGVRNRLAHAYGEVDREIIWQVIEQDLPVLLKACRGYCDDHGLDLS